VKELSVLPRPCRVPRARTSLACWVPRAAELCAEVAINIADYLTEASLSSGEQEITIEGSVKDDARIGDGRSKRASSSWAVVLELRIISSDAELLKLKSMSQTHVYKEVARFEDDMVLEHDKDLLDAATAHAAMTGESVSSYLDDHRPCGSSSVYLRGLTMRRVKQTLREIRRQGLGDVGPYFQAWHSKCVEHLLKAR